MRCMCGGCHDCLAAQGGYDIPEECPVCGKPNADEDGEPVYPQDSAFCSEHCANEYAADQRFHDHNLYLDYVETERLIEETS